MSGTRVPTMAEDILKDAEASAVKAVASLRSHFEHISTSSSNPNGAPITSRQGTHSRVASRDTIRPPLSTQDIDKLAPRSPSRTNPAAPPSGLLAQQTSTKKRPPTPPKSRLKTKPIIAQPQPPQVNVTSPTSPPRKPDLPVMLGFNHGPRNPMGERTTSPVRTSSAPFRIPSRPASPQKQQLFGNTGTSPRKSRDPFLNPQTLADGAGQMKVSKGTAAPDVKRASKPQIGSRDTPLPLDGTSASLRVGQPSSVSSSRKPSPFTTPPESGTMTPVIQDAPPVIPHYSKPAVQASARPNVALFQPPPTHHTVAEKRKEADARRSLDGRPAMPGPPADAGRKVSQVDGEPPPMLPPRRDVSMTNPYPEPPVRKSLDNVPKPSALSMGFSNTAAPRQPVSRTPTFAPPTPIREARHALPTSRAPSGAQTPPRALKEANIRPTMSITIANTASGGSGLASKDYPDSSKANRRPPHFREGPRMISNTYDTRIFAACGEYMCTTGSTTRVWSLLTGKLILSMNHGEGVKVTAVCFKPSRKIEDEGTTLWLGTNWGAILELDINLKKVVASNDVSHHRHEICGMWRREPEIWTLDSEGKFFVWPAASNGAPSLQNGVANTKTGRRPTASVVIGDQLWLAFGKEIRVLRPSQTFDDDSVELMHGLLSIQDLGDMTAATILNKGGKQVYFGHSDGKISVFSSDYTCQAVYNVGSHKISSLVGVGADLWAGYSNGMIYVYDISTTPWTVQKDWRAHSNPVLDMILDHSSIWKLNRLQVLSLGGENIAGVWDGMLEEDWLDNDMHSNSANFCSFRDTSALIVSWNVGASKAATLGRDSDGDQFFRRLFKGGNSAGIIVFGLQELVDLEDKRLTAKTIFKSKKNDEFGQEQLTKVYREWRDYLSDCVSGYMPDQNYTLLHTASLVGLFMCVFVKTCERSHVREVQAAQVKTGLGGLHGNKGALLVSFTFDDSSLCFVNCHLAAGQGHWAHRNSDVATVLENSYLSGLQLPPSRTETFVSGGDGTMVLDHEICFFQGDLNYRIDGMARDAVVNAVDSQDFDKLLEHDQLSVQRLKNPGFRLRAFHEAPITFDPTYKYDVGTDNYDSSEKRRIPAWCDRILYRGDQITAESYQRHEVRISDHRPVSAHFQLRVKTIRGADRVKCWRESEKRFAKVKHDVSTAAKLEYLQSTFGMTVDEARKVLMA